LEDNLPVDFIY